MPCPPIPPTDEGEEGDKRFVDELDEEFELEEKEKAS